MSYTIEGLQGLRRRYLAARDIRDELYLREQEDPDFTIKDAEEQQDAREEAVIAEADLYGYVVAGIAAGAFSDRPRSADQVAAELALGRYDDDLG